MSSTTTTVPKLYTAGRIAEILDVPVEHVRKAIATRAIRESAMAGTLKVYNRAAVDLIREAIAVGKGGVGAPH